MKRTHALLLTAALLSGCSSSEAEIVTSPIKVASYNLYLGADIAPIMAATDGATLIGAVSAAWAQVLANDFTLRAVAIADQIEAEGPDLIGLQEVSIYRVQSPGDAIVGGTVPATDVVFDFLDILLAELASRGLTYAEVSSIENVDVEMPFTFDGGVTFDDLRLTDRDVILAKAGTTTAGPLAMNFSDAVTLPVVVGDPPGIPIMVKRGWCSINAMAGDTWFTFVNTHLETVLDLGIPGIHAYETYYQEGQAVELMGALATFPTPIVLVGDLNSAADGSTSRSYPNTINAGFGDAWTSAMGDGYTCCQDEDLLNADNSVFTERIDFILGNGDISFSGADRIGEEVADKETVLGLWPSDHSGVAATANIPQ
jgi:hypothetical protein